MARSKLKLTFHAASKRWCKYHHGKRFYYGSGTSKSDEQSYRAAMGRYDEHMAEYDAADAARTEAFHTRLAIHLDNTYGVKTSVAVPVGVTVEGKTIGQVANAYVDYQTGRLAEGAISEARLTSIDSSIKRLTKSIGNVKISKSDDGTIEAALDQYRAYLFGNGYKMATITDSLQICSALMVWAYERRHLNHLPRNLKSSTKGKQREKNPNPLTVKQVKRLLAEARPNFRCYCLIALNCGLYPVDIGALTPANIKGGHLRYVRSKTERYDSGLGVYKLWGETIKAINETSSDGEYLFKTRLSKPISKDNLRQAFNKFNFEGKTFGSLRDTSATLIDTWARQGEFVNNVKQQFLAHKDSSVAAHYTGRIEDVDPSQIKMSELDKALRMLEGVYLG